MLTAARDGAIWCTSRVMDSTATDTRVDVKRHDHDVCHQVTWRHARPSYPLNNAPWSVNAFSSNISLLFLRKHIGWLTNDVPNFNYKLTSNKVNVIKDTILNIL